MTAYMSDESPPTAQRAEVEHAGDRLWLEIVRGIFQVITEGFRTFGKGLEWKNLAVLGAMFVSWLVLLKQEDRPKISDLTAAAEKVIVRSPWIWAGWACTVLLLLVGLPTMVYLNRRVRTQGDELRWRRAKDDPARLSSGDPDGIRRAGRSLASAPAETRSEGEGTKT